MLVFQQGVCTNYDTFYGDLPLVQAQTSCPAAVGVSASVLGLVLAVLGIACGCCQLAAWRRSGRGRGEGRPLIAQ